MEVVKNFCVATCAMCLKHQQLDLVGAQLVFPSASLPQVEPGAVLVVGPMTVADFVMAGFEAVPGLGAVLGQSFVDLEVIFF